MPSWKKALKYAAFVIAGTLWVFGLAEQFSSFELTARYVMLSGAMVVVATV